MKRLLLYAYYYPPDPEAGALRPYYLASYLPYYDWHATIVTRPAYLHPPARATNPIRELFKPLKLARRIQSVAKSLWNFPDAGRHWFKKALQDGLDTLKRVRHDAVLTTAPPATMHLLGSATVKQTGLPWVADDRDLWSGNPYRDLGPMRAALERALEKNALKRAAVVTTVSESCAVSLEQILGKRPRVIPNAVSTEDWADVPDKLPQHFTLCYAGRLYASRRTPDLLFEAIATMRRRADPIAAAIRLQFFGPDGHLVQAAAERHQVTDLVEIFGVTERREVLVAERSAAVLLLLLSSAAQTSGEYGSKVFEYVSARRPILALGPDNSVVKTLVEDSGAGLYASTVDRCILAIGSLYRNFIGGNYEPTLNPNWRPYDARTLARDFATLLDEITS